MYLKKSSLTEEPLFYLFPATTLAVVSLSPNFAHAEDDEEDEEEEEEEEEDDGVELGPCKVEDATCFKGDAATIGIVSAAPIITFAVLFFIVPNSLRESAVKKGKSPNPAGNFGIALCVLAAVFVFIASVFGMHGYTPDGLGVAFGILLLLALGFAGFTFSKTN